MASGGCATIYESQRTKARGSTVSVSARAFASATVASGVLDSGCGVLVPPGVFLREQPFPGGSDSTDTFTIVCSPSWPRGVVTVLREFRNLRKCQSQSVLASSNDQMGHREEASRLEVLCERRGEPLGYRIGPVRFATSFACSLKQV
jgi:hypothetical protein